MSPDASRARASAPTKSKTDTNQNKDTEGIDVESFHDEAHEELGAKGYSRVNKPVLLPPAS